MDNDNDRIKYLEACIASRDRLIDSLREVVAYLNRGAETATASIEGRLAELRADRTMIPVVEMFFAVLNDRQPVSSIRLWRNTSDARSAFYDTDSPYQVTIGSGPKCAIQIAVDGILETHAVIDVYNDEVPVLRSIGWTEVDHDHNRSPLAGAPMNDGTVLGVGSVIRLGSSARYSVRIVSIQRSRILSEAMETEERWWPGSMAKQPPPAPPPSDVVGEVVRELEQLVVRIANDRSPYSQVDTLRYTQFKLADLRHLSNALESWSESRSPDGRATKVCDMIIDIAQSNAAAVEFVRLMNLVLLPLARG